MLGAAKKKLIIVVDEKTKCYGELISALITMNDDNPEHSECSDVVGVKDGSVETVIWTEKIYTDNQAQLGSNNKVLFIGNFDAAKAVSANVIPKNAYDEYGIKFGYIANKAIIVVDENHLSTNKPLYEGFYEAYSALCNSCGSAYIAGQLTGKVEIKDEVVKLADKERTGFAQKAAGLFKKIDQAAAKGVSFLSNGKEIVAQQYRCAIISFYLNKLAEFMGE